MRFLPTLLLLLGALAAASRTILPPFNATDSLAAANVDSLPPSTDTTFWTPLDYAPNNTRAIGIVYRCETSGSSPLVFDVVRAVSMLYDVNNDNTCIQNKPGNVCDRMLRYNTAGLDICGPQSFGWRPFCTVPADIYQMVVDLCERKVGGSWRVGGWWRVVHMPGFEGVRMDLNMFHT